MKFNVVTRKHYYGISIYGANVNSAMLPSYNESLILAARLAIIHALVMLLLLLFQKDKIPSPLSYPVSTND